MELNLLTFHTRFPNEDACYEYVATRRWPDGPVCGRCGSVSVYTCKTRRIYKCKDCRRQFSPLAGTIFQDSHLPLIIWFMAVYLLTLDGVSSTKLSAQLGITQKTAWFLMQRIMEAMEEKDIVLSGVVQVDETYYGPKRLGRSSARYSNKYAIIGAVEAVPGGKAVFQVVKQPDTTVAREFIERYIKPGSVVHTDESRIYGWLRYHYDHATVNHSQRQYVYEGITSNKIENSWMHTKRVIKGRHVRVTGKHLSTYVRGGHQFRYNARDLTTEERFEKWFGLAGCKPPLPHKELIKKQAERPLALRGWARKRAMLPTQTSLF